MRLLMLRRAAYSKTALRVIELQEEHRERHNVTVDTITAELDENRTLALECDQPGAATAATMGKAKIHGLVTDKKELAGKDGAPLETIINFVPVNSK